MLTDQELELVADADQTEAVSRLNKDLRDASKMLGRNEARLLVDSYYQIQKSRIRAKLQADRNLGANEPARLLAWVRDSMRIVENNIKSALNLYAKQYTVGLWMQSITGIGPVLSAAFLCEIDIRKTRTAGNLWRFAGQDPTCTWEKGKKRPWNARLKTLCWKLGESFVKVINNKNDYYGQIYIARKVYEQERNDRGDNAELCKTILAGRKWDKTTDAFRHYTEGHLPPAHIHARAKRYAVKLFLSHLHHVMHVDFYGTNPPGAYVIEMEIGGHRHYVEPPNWPFAKPAKSLKESFGSETPTATPAE